MCLLLYCISSLLHRGLCTRYCHCVCCVPHVRALGHVCLCALECACVFMSCVSDMPLKCCEECYRAPRLPCIHHSLLAEQADKASCKQKECVCVCCAKQAFRRATRPMLAWVLECCCCCSQCSSVSFVLVFTSDTYSLLACMHACKWGLLTLSLY